MLATTASSTPDAIATNNGMFICFLPKIESLRPLKLVDHQSMEFGIVSPRLDLLPYDVACIFVHRNYRSHGFVQLFPVLYAILQPGFRQKIS